jgi:AcrR family transcriptional regulator
MDYSEKQILIFDGVMTLLREGRPVHELKVADITESAGIGKSTAYEYFTSKEEIIREALAYHLRENFRRFAAYVFSAGTFRDMIRNALDHMEESLDGQSTGIFFMVLMEHRVQLDNGAYLDDAFRQKMETMLETQIRRITAIGTEEGQIAGDLTMTEIRMILFGFFTAYIRNLMKIKLGVCGNQGGKDLKDKREQEAEISQLKDQTLKLLLKALK